MGHESCCLSMILSFYGLKVRFMLSFNTLLTLKILIHSLTCALTLGNPVSQKERDKTFLPIYNSRPWLIS